MKIGVLVKRVPDSASKIRIKADGSGIETDGVKFLMNPFDEFAVEEALISKEKSGGDSSVTALSLGADETVEILRTALAMGADRAIHVKAADSGEQDSMAMAHVLAAVIEREGFDIVFAGKQAIDMDSAQAPAVIAELLGWPQVYVAVEFSLAEDGRSARVNQSIEGGDEVVDVEFPCIVTCEKGLNEPRYASLPGIMKAKTKPLEVVEPADTGADPAKTGAAGSRTAVKAYESLPERGTVRMIDGEVEEQAAELVRSLREDSKVI